MPWVPGLAVRILTHERARAGRMAATEAFLALVRRHGLAGITITRAIEGASAHGGMRSSGVIELGDDVPLVVEIVDRADRIEPLLPEIATLVQSGVLTVVPLRVYFPASHLHVRDVLDPARVVAHPETPLVDILHALLDQDARLIPVVDNDRHVEGVLTLGLLLERVDASLAHHLIEQEQPEHVRRHILSLAEGHTAGEYMRPQPVVIRDDQPIEAAARTLTAHQVTCAPVADARQYLVGLIGEHALTRALVGPLLDEHTSSERTTATTLRLGTAPAAGDLLTAGTLADRDVPTLDTTAPWPVLVRSVEQSPRGLALVVDAQGHLAGTLTERVLFEHVLPGAGEGPMSALRRLVSRAPGLPRTLPGGDDSSRARADAAALLRPADVSVAPDLPAADALARMLEHQGSDCAVVVGADGRPLGVLWRDVALRALVGG